MIYPQVYLCNCTLDQIMTKTHFFSSQVELVYTVFFSFFSFKKRLPTKQYVILKVMVHFYSYGKFKKIILYTFANT